MTKRPTNAPAPAPKPKPKPKPRQEPDPEPPEAAVDDQLPILATTVQAAAEIAEIGLSLCARAIRTAVAKLPRP